MGGLRRLAFRSGPGGGEGSGERKRKGEAGRSPRRTFTELLKALEAGGDPPDEGTVRELWEGLKAALIAELRRRNSWDSPPAYLGVFGAQTWRPEGGAGRGEDPVDELVAAAYAHLFVERLRALLAQLQVKENVDGLVFLSLRQFLHDRQREADPLGSRIYEALHGAVREALESGRAQVLSGDPRVRNDTVLGFGAAQAPEPTAGALAALARRWGQELFPDLVTAHGAGRRPVLARLRDLLADLPAEGVEVVRFRDLVEPLKSDARARWAGALERSGLVAAEEGDEELREIADQVGPERRFADRDAFAKLVNCVFRLIERLGGSEADRENLARLWRYLLTWTSGQAGEEGVPSQRGLAELFRLSRDRLRSLQNTVASLVRRCQIEISSKVRVLSDEGGVPPPAPPGRSS